MNWRTALIRFQAAGEPACLVTVAATQGSTPREAGARMVVTAAASEGTVGGGQLEYQALAVARRIRTGTFSINGGNYFSPDSPFGGYKQSGIGREMGTAGLEEFLESKTFATVVS